MQSQSLLVRVGAALCQALKVSEFSCFCRRKTHGDAVVTLIATASGRDAATKTREALANRHETCEAFVLCMRMVS